MVICGALGWIKKLLKSVFLGKIITNSSVYSYPFSEDVDDGTSYMKTRCPGWCDRILGSHNVRDIIVQVSL